MAVPLRILARYWVAYYWPFVDAGAPIYQGQRRSTGAGGRGEDMEFRPALATLRAQWEEVIGQPARALDGFAVIADMMVYRRRGSYSKSFIAAYQRAVGRIEQALKQPIQFAGNGNCDVREASPLERLGDTVVGVRAHASDACVVVSAELWQTFAKLSLWIEALSPHEWCLFSEGVVQASGSTVDRGHVYRLLTDRPDNRRPLTWERNRVDLLVLEEPGVRMPVDGAPDHLRHSLRSRSLYPADRLSDERPLEPFTGGPLVQRTQEA